MAEFIDTKAQTDMRASDRLTADGMAAFGKPVPNYRKSAALQHARDMGLTDTNKATGMINRTAEFIERDEPYKAMEAITAYLDLTGAYRLLAVLCAASEPPKEPDIPEQDEEAFKRAHNQKKSMIYDEWGF